MSSLPTKLCYYLMATSYPPRPAHPLSNEESFEMDELNDDPSRSTEQEELMPKAVMEGEADSLSTWAWLSALW
jgi:hypothetical protein